VGGRASGEAAPGGRMQGGNKMGGKGEGRTNTIHKN
jgi:hypothetical protein